MESGSASLTLVREPGKIVAPFSLGGYEHTLKQVTRVVGPVYDACLATNIAMHTALRELLNYARYALWAMVDGTDVAAWTSQQRGWETELASRTAVPNVGGRMIDYGPRGKISTTDGEPISVSASFKFWRGYYLVVLCHLVAAFDDLDPVEKVAAYRVLARILDEQVYRQLELGAAAWPRSHEALPG